MAWIDDAKKRIEQLREGKGPAGEVTYKLFRGLDDQEWTLRLLEQAADLFERRPAAAGSEAWDREVTAWLERFEGGPTIDRAGWDWTHAVRPDPRVI